MSKLNRNILAMEGKIIRVYRSPHRTLVCSGPYDASIGRLEYLVVKGHIAPTCLKAVLDIVEPLHHGPGEDEDDEWTFTKDEWLGMTADCPELMELASCVVEG